MEPGSSWPLHRGAIAKVLLAYAPDDIVDEVLGTDDGEAAEPVVDPAALHADLAQL